VRSLGDRLGFGLGLRFGLRLGRRGLGQGRGVTEDTAVRRRPDRGVICARLGRVGVGAVGRFVRRTPEEPLKESHNVESCPLGTTTRNMGLAYGLRYPR